MINEMTLIAAKHQKKEWAVEIAEHVLRYAELTVVLDGELEYRSGNKKIHLFPGDVLFLKQGSLRARNRPLAAADYFSFNFRVSRDFDLPQYIKGAVTGEVEFLLKNLDFAIERRNFHSGTEKICHLLSALLLCLEDEQKMRSSHPLVRKIILFLQKNLALRITLDDVARHCYFSSVYCDSVFKKEMGVSVIHYLIDLRLQEAKLLLHQGHFCIAEVAELTGFRDANYFSRVFKKRIGVSPTHYRRSV